MNRDEAELIATIKADNAEITSMKVKSASVSAVVHRHETGIDEDLGYVSYYHRNLIKHYYINLMIWLRGKYRLWQQFWLTEAKK
jgi:hypothetical protein